MNKKVKIAPSSEELLTSTGIKPEDVRCKCGKKLLEVVRSKGAVIRVKCTRCGNIISIEI